MGADLGFVKLLIGACGALYVASLLMSPGAFEFSGLFQFLSPGRQALFLLGASGAAPVYGLGRWWTVLSASLLHGGLLHILFNMLWVRNLATPVADLYGAGRMVLIWTAASVVGFTASSSAQAFLPPIPLIGGGGVMTVGASASIFGLLGALVLYGRRSGQSAMRQQVWTWAVVMFVFGVLMPGVDNWAHAGGFAGGYLAARWLDPLKPERIEHLALALVCLIATGLAVAVSVITGMKLLAGGPGG
ncbi:MAG: rhomboid family intramembrane serine protease [Thermoanaerobaculia bacterium]